MKFLIDLFEKRPDKKHSRVDATVLEEPIDITRHAQKEVFTEVISSAPDTVIHHTTQNADTTKTSFALPQQTNNSRYEPAERIMQVHKSTHDLTNREASMHTETSSPGHNRVKEVEEQLKIRQRENDRLRNDLHIMATKLESMEYAAEKLKKDHELQRKESAIQLNAMNRKLEETMKQLYNCQWEKDEVKTVKDELVKEKQSNSDHEKRLNEANTKIAELLRQMERKEEHMLLKIDSSNTDKVQEELEKERLLKFDLVKNLSIANEKISTLRKQIEDLEKQDHKENSAYKQALHELNTEKRLRKEYETRLNEIKKELDRELQLKRKEAERDKLISATLKELSEEKQTRIEQEKLLNATKHRFITLGKRLEEVENELEKTKKQLAKERLTKRNQEKLLNDANKKLSGLCDMLDEKQSQPTLNGAERDQTRLFGDEILYISKKSPGNNKTGNVNAVAVAPLSDFPEVSSSSHPLANLHAGSQRPKRKKNHSPLSPIIIGATPKDSSPTNSDSDDLIQF